MCTGHLSIFPSFLARKPHTWPGRCMGCPGLTGASSSTAPTGTAPAREPHTMAQLWGCHLCPPAQERALGHHGHSMGPPTPLLLPHPLPFPQTWHCHRLAHVPRPALVREFSLKHKVYLLLLGGLCKMVVSKLSACDSCSGLVCPFPSALPGHEPSRVTICSLGTADLTWLRNSTAKIQ